MQKFFFIIFIVLLASNSYAQTKQADSLKSLISKTTNLRERYKLPANQNNETTVAGNCIISDCIFIYGMHIQSAKCKNKIELRCSIEKEN